MNCETKGSVTHIIPALDRKIKIEWLPTSGHVNAVRPLAAPPQPDEDATAIDSCTGDAEIGKLIKGREGLPSLREALIRIKKYNFVI